MSMSGLLKGMDPFAYGAARRVGLADHLTKTLDPLDLFADPVTPDVPAVPEIPPEMKGGVYRDIKKRKNVLDATTGAAASAYAGAAGGGRYQALGRPAARNSASRALLG